MDRREFIKKSGVAAAGALLATPFASMLAKDDKNKKGMKIVVTASMTSTVRCTPIRNVPS